jgi:hypothetical protein
MSIVRVVTRLATGRARASDLHAVSHDEVGIASLRSQ